jgi:hypothetical protein
LLLTGFGLARDNRVRFADSTAFVAASFQGFDATFA